MIPYYSPLYATVQDQPRQGVYRVAGWGLTGQPYLIPLKTLSWTRINRSCTCEEWDTNFGHIVFHDTKAEALAEHQRMVADLKAVLRGAEKLTKAAVTSKPCTDWDSA